MTTIVRCNSHSLYEHLYFVIKYEKQVARSKFEYSFGGFCYHVQRSCTNFSHQAFPALLVCYAQLYMETIVAIIM